MIFGRSLDVDDLICNFIGIAAGFFIGLAIRNIKGKNKTTEEQPTVSSSSKTAKKQRERSTMKNWLKKNWLKVLERVHTKESKIMANRIKPAKTISSLS